jgi:crotonobetainyl-CoA:carnitine CoA-transferase CaiB-like acyl-CoA transferase
MDACAALQAAPLLDSMLSGDKPPAAIIVPSGIFRTKDGYVTVASLSDTMFAALLKALGLDALRSDPRYATLEARRENAPAINAEVARTLAGEDTRHWVRKLSAVDVLCAEVMDYAGFRASPQSTHTETFCEVDQFPYGALPLARVPGGRREWPVGPAPRVGEHTLEILAEAGVTGTECAALIDSGIVHQAPSK